MLYVITIAVDIDVRNSDGQVGGLVKSHVSDLIKSDWKELKGATAQNGSISIKPLETLSINKLVEVMNAE